MWNPDYREMLSIFDDHDVAYLMVGAYAMAGHGFPRATGDIDLWVEATPENAERVVAALADFGAPRDHFDKASLTTKGTVIQIGVAPCRIDILTHIDGVEFSEARARCEVVELEGVSFPVLSRDDLIANKRATGRKKDALDVEWLEGTGS